MRAEINLSGQYLFYWSGIWEPERLKNDEHKVA